jgi:hypothetical protein
LERSGETEVERSGRGITLLAPRLSGKGPLVGSALIFVDAYFQFYAEPMRVVWLTNATPFANVIFLLFLLTVLNALLGRVLPRLRLSSSDLIAVYVMLSIQTGLGSAHCIHWLMGSISYGPWGATENNRWASEYLPHLPAWLMITDPDALKGYYLGNSSLFTPRHLRAWLLPVLWWTLLLYAIAAVLAAVAVLFSRQWIRRERLSFPVVELTFQMVSPGTTFWRQRLTWFGFGLAATAELINGLHYLFPSVPELPIRRIDIGPLFTEPPWNALGETNLSFYPFIIGLSFLIPLDLSISLCIFYLLHKAQFVSGAVVGWSEIPNYPFVRDQQFGAGAAILMAALWTSREHLRQVWRVAWSSEAAAPAPDQEEARLYRRSLVTLAVGTVAIPWFMAAAGLAWWMAFVVYGMYVFMGLVVSRIRCELGFPMHDMLRMNGPNVLMLANGAQDLGAKHVTVLALFNSFTLANQNHILPHQFEGVKLADRSGMHLGSMTAVMVVATLVAVPATFLVYLETTYRLGASSAHIPLGQSGRSMYEQILPAWLHSDVYRAPDFLALGVMAGSFGFTLCLMFLRLRFLGWPLHPLGLALANSGSGVGDVVCAVFIASVLKGMILHCGGLKAYRGALPFFLGLMLGDLVAGMAWVAGGILFNTPTYRFFL